MKRIALMLFLAVTAITLSIGLADAGTYTVKWVNVTSVNDTLNLNFVSTVSNATLVLNSTAKIDVFPLAATTEPAQYCIKISGNWINITNSTGYLKASFYDSNFWKYVNSTGADIRITNQSSQLYFWIQDFNATTEQATIWVNLTAGSTELDIYYGSPSASPSAYNNGSKVFLFFDNFNEFTSKWILQGGSTVVDTNGILKLSSGTYAYGDIVTSKNFKNDIVIYTKYKVNSTSWAGMVWMYNNESYTYRLLEGYSDNNTRLDGLIFNGSITNWETWVTTNYDVHTFNTYEIICKNGTQKIIVDGKHILTTYDNSLIKGKIGFGVYSEYCDIDYIFVASSADPATFGIPYQTQQITVTVGTFTITTNASTIAIPLTAFSSTTHVIITPAESARFNATLTFNYAYSATSTVRDTGVMIEKKFTVNTTGLSAPIILNLTYPHRAAYKLIASVTPSTTIKNFTTDDVVVSEFTLQNNTVYSIDEKIGFLICNITAKDELTQSALSTVIVNFTGSTGWTSLSGAKVSIYGTDIPVGLTQQVIEVGSTGYPARKLILDCTKLNQDITAYLLADSSATMVTFTVVSGASTLSNAKIQIYKYIGAEWVLIDSEYTDASGVAAVPLHAFDSYKIVASKPGYDTVTATITVTQSTYTIKMGGISLALPSLSRTIILFKPTESTLQPGNNTLEVEIIPRNTTITTATVQVYINRTLAKSVTKTDISQTTLISIPVTLNQSSSVEVKVTYIEGGKTVTENKNYTVPLLTGMWATLYLMNQQLAKTPNGKVVGLLIAAFIALAVVAGLAATTTTNSRGLGLVGLIVFTIIALPLNAIPLNLLIIVWVAVFASWIVWRWI